MVLASSEERCSLSNGFADNKFICTVLKIHFGFRLSDELSCSFLFFFECVWSSIE
ncbi:hypothetical protein Bca4012_007577 [Brassica carinata]